MPDYKGNSAAPVELSPIDPGGSATGELSERTVYQIDWSDRIGAASISSSAWFISGKVRQPSASGFSASVTGSVTTIWLESATSATGSTATVSNTVTLNSGERLTRSFTITLKTR